MAPTVEKKTRGNDMSAARAARVEKARVKQAKLEKMQAVAAKARAARGVGATEKVTPKVVPKAAASPKHGRR
jgi:hypothetical protein